MSGIAGWIARGAGPEPDALPAMLEAIGHRGNEGLCAFVDRGGGRELVMGAGACDEPARIALTLDGSIANARDLHAELQKRGHHFEAINDCEILLRAYVQWDKEVVRHLRGQFALAIWDGRKERLMLARDRFGEKPLYLYESGGVLAFASEPKALRKAFALEVDPQAVRDCLAQSYVPGAATLFRGVRKLAPATQALWHFGRLMEARYWMPPDREPYTGVPVSGAVEAFTGELEEAVRVRPAEAVFLSGGLDSAALVAFASRNDKQLRTYTFGLAKDRNSELGAAAEVAKQFATIHHEVVATPEELAAALPKVVILRDAPATRPSDVAIYVLANAARGRRVLTGDGCDEVLGGYRRYVTARLKGGLRPALYAAQTGTLPDQVLERSERLGAAASVQTQQPFLDHCLAETVSALPDAMRVRGMATKWMLREASRAFMPQVPRRTQGGYRIRARDLMTSELLLQYLGAANSRMRQYHDAAILDRLLKEHADGKKNHEIALWTLLNLEIWHRSCASG
jgi:asparagine synthase (glutamine-hydrolysing)